jgi:hypothetical protein
MSNITLYEKIDNPAVLQNLQALGKEFSASGILGINNPAQGVVLAMTCIAENITPIEFSRTYHVVMGRLTMRADAMQAKFQESGGRIEWIRSDERECEAKFIHRDYAPNGVMLKITHNEMVETGVAKDEKGNIKGTWKKHPRQMLRARIISEGVRMVNPSIVAGYYTPEEVSDFDDKPKSRGNLLPPKTKPEEPKDAEATVIDDAAPETSDTLLAANEKAVNTYLEQDRKWINVGQTWRDLNPAHRDVIDKRLHNFIKKAKQYTEQPQETVNA